MPDTDTRPYEYEFTVTREAATTITEMREHCANLAGYWGLNSPEYREAVTSFVNQLSRLFGSPMSEKVRVARDYDLSLIVFTDRITFGMNWGGKKRVCTDPDCHAFIDDDGSVSTWSTEKAPMLDHEHTPSYPIDAPQPGTWTFNS